MMPDREDPSDADDGSDAIPLGVFAEPLDDGAVVLRGFVREHAPALLVQLACVADAAPFRRMVTMGGQRMSAAMTNCGALGWITDAHGYRYVSRDPLTDLPWPALPALFAELARAAAATAGFADFAPDACLINHYEPGARMTMHRDDTERSYTAPIVSMSLGLPIAFKFGGFVRTDPSRRIPLTHGDVVVWGGPSRLRYHGVLPLKDGLHPLTGRHRFNLTFRSAG